MNEKIVTLTDGTKLEIKVNFMTLYMIQKNGLGKFLNRKSEKELDNLSDNENMEMAAKLIHAILRSNGLKVDKEEAMMLTPMDPEAIKILFEEFEKRVKEYKKKEQKPYPKQKKKKKK